MLFGNSPMKHQKFRRRFTLIELLIAIGIIGVLISCSRPWGRCASRRVRTKGMANLRSVATTFAQYAGQYQVYPFIQPRREDPGPGEMDVPGGFIGCSWIRPAP